MTDGKHMSGDEPLDEGLEEEFGEISHTDEDYLWDDDFWKAAAARAIRTMSQTALAMLPAMARISEVNWVIVIETAALAGIASILMSVATGLPEAK
jgi:hypothetical protein